MTWRSCCHLCNVPGVFTGGSATKNAPWVNPCWQVSNTIHNSARRVAPNRSCLIKGVTRVAELATLTCFDFFQENHGPKTLPRNSPENALNEATWTVRVASFRQILGRFWAPFRAQNLAPKTEFVTEKNTNKSNSLLQVDTVAMRQASSQQYEQHFLQADSLRSFFLQADTWQWAELARNNTNSTLYRLTH